MLRRLRKPQKRLRSLEGSASARAAQRLAALAQMLSIRGVPSSRSDT